MAAKVFIKGDFRDFFISNKDSKYKVFYNEKWNNIQTKENVVNNLTETEHYVDTYLVKVYNNGVFIDLALLENYYSDYEVQKSVFYQLLTKDNFDYNLKGIDETNIDFRLGLNNLKCILKTNENFEFENSNLIIYDNLQAFLNKENFYNDTLLYNKANLNNINCGQNVIVDDNFSQIQYISDKTLTKKYDITDNTDEFEQINVEKIGENSIIICPNNDLKKVDYIKFTDFTVVNNGGTSAGIIVRFLNESNEVIESGDIISYNGSTEAETENFIIKSSSSWPGSSSWGCLYGFTTTIIKDTPISTNNDLMLFNSGDSNKKISLQFKNTPIISSIKYNLRPGSGSSYGYSGQCKITLHFTDGTISSCDLICSDTTKMNVIDSKSFASYTVDNESKIIIKKFFENNVSKFKKFKIDCYRRNNNDIGISLLYNNLNYVYENDNWIQDDNKYMSIDSFELLNNKNMIKLTNDFINIKLEIKLFSDDCYYTPVLRGIYMMYTEKSYGRHLDINHFRFECSGNHACMFMRFYDKDDNMIKNDIMVSSTSNSAETEKFKIECSIGAFNSASLPIYALLTKNAEIDRPIDGYNCFFCGGTGDNTIKIYPKNNVMLDISKISFCNQISCNGLGSSLNEVKLYIVKNDESEIEVPVKLQTNATEDIVIADFDYEVSINDTCFISNLNSLNTNNTESIVIDCEETQNSKIRFAFSEDNVNWSVIKNNMVISIDKNDIIFNGNTKTELENMNKNFISRLKYIMVAMISYNKDENVILRKISFLKKI